MRTWVYHAIHSFERPEEATLTLYHLPGRLPESSPIGGPFLDRGSQKVSKARRPNGCGKHCVRQHNRESDARFFVDVIEGDRVKFRHLNSGGLKYVA